MTESGSDEPELSLRPMRAGEIGMSARLCRTKPARERGQAPPEAASRAGALEDQHDSASRSWRRLSCPAKPRPAARHVPKRRAQTPGERIAELRDHAARCASALRPMSPKSPPIIPAPRPEARPHPAPCRGRLLGVVEMPTTPPSACRFYDRARPPGDLRLPQATAELYPFLTAHHRKASAAPAASAAFPRRLATRAEKGGAARLGSAQVTARRSRRDVVNKQRAAP